MSPLISTPPSLHCLDSTVRISRRPRHRMVQHHSTPHPRLVWDFYSYPKQYFDLTVFAHPFRPLVYETHVPHRPRYYVCTPCMHGLPPPFSLSSRCMTRSETSPPAASVEALPILNEWRAQSLRFRPDFPTTSQRSQRLTISPHPYVLP